MPNQARNLAFTDDTGTSKTPRILVVEDDPALRFAVSGVLRMQHFEVVEADCLEAATAKLDAGLDLVIADLRLPDGEGLSLLGLLRDIDPTIAVIIVTGFGTVDLAVRALKNGAENFLTKPVDSEELLSQVRAALLKRGPRPIGEQVDDDVPPVKARMTSEVQLRAMPEEATLKDVEREAIRRALVAENGRVEAAARRLGVPRSTLYQKVKVYGLHVPRVRGGSEKRVIDGVASTSPVPSAEAPPRTGSEAGKA
jgi:DNA-binding NtrC family response regulator